MSDGSTIEWLNRPGTKPATWNPIRAHDKLTGKRGWFCVHVHGGCVNCYAEKRNINLGDSGGNGHAYIAQNIDKVDISLHEPTLLQPLKWRQPRTIFVCSMTDLYGAWVKDEWLDKIKAVQALTPRHTYIELTKRPERMREYLSAPEFRHRLIVAIRDLGKQHDALEQASGRRTITPAGIIGANAWAASENLAAAIPGSKPTLPLPNVWGLVSCSTQEDADKFIPILLNTPLAIRGVSAEPLLGPIDFTRLARAPDKYDREMPGFGNVTSFYLDALTGLNGITFPGNGNIPINAETSTGHGLNWVIIGGESGRNARPMHPDWARAIVSQCEAAGVAVFMKQWGEWAPYDRGRVDSANLATPKSLDTPMQAVGKKLSGRLLDGRTYDGFPETTP